MRESIAAHPHFALRPGAFRPEGRRGRSLPPEGLKKVVDFGRKPHCFRPKTANFFRCVHHFCTDRSTFGREKAHSGAKKSDIAPSPLPKIGESRAPRKANLKRKLRQVFEFLFLSRKRLFVFTASKRNKRAKERAYPKDCVPLGYHPRRHAPFGAGRRAQRITIS